MQAKKEVERSGLIKIKRVRDFGLMGGGLKKAGKIPMDTLKWKADAYRKQYNPDVLTVTRKKKPQKGGRGEVLKSNSNNIGEEAAKRKRGKNKNTLKTINSHQAGLLEIAKNGRRNMFFGSQGETI